jgi:hypothetical protein
MQEAWKSVFEKASNIVSPNCVRVIQLSLHYFDFVMK